MSGVAAHVCPRREDGSPDMSTCGTCFGSWCATCDPSPASLCHWCCGRGYSLAPIPPRQRRAMGVHYPSRRGVKA